MAEPLDAAGHPLTVVLDDDQGFADFVESWLRRQGLQAVPLVAGQNSTPGILPPGHDGSPAPNRHGRLFESRIALGSLVIDSARRTVELRGVEVHLTPTEFRLLQYLTERPDRLVGHGELLGAVWGPGYEDDVHLLQVTMRSLRARLAAVSGEPLIETVYGTGYRMARRGPSPSAGAGQRSWAASAPARGGSGSRSGHGARRLGPHGAAA